MLRTLLRDESNHFRVVDDPAAISDIVMHKERLLWLDLENPTNEEFALIQEEFNLHPLAIEDAMARHQRPKVDQYDNFYLVIFYSVGIETPGEAAIAPGRRGLRGSAFHRPARLPDPAPGVPLPPDGAADHLTTEHQGVINERVVLRELTMFMAENYLVTVHTHPIPELEEAALRWRRNAETIIAEHLALKDLPGTRPLIPDERTQLKHPRSVTDESRGQRATGRPTDDLGLHHDDVGILLYSLLDSITDNYFPVIDSIVERIEDLEEQIFEKFDQKAIESIFTLKKDLLALRKVLAPERDVLNVLIRRDLPIFDAHTIVYFQDVYDHIVRITDSIDTYRDLLSSALDSYLSMQSNRLNVTVQTLTSVSIMLMSVSAITGWYGMNFVFMPELNSRLGYPAVMLAVVVIVIVEFIFFKRKGWL